MLFTVNKKPLLKENPELEAVPEFAACSERELRYIFLVYDYDSPYRNMEFQRRKKECAINAGFKMETPTKLDKNGRNTINGNIPKVEKAIRKFMELQFDSDKADLAAYDAQLAQFREYFHKNDKSTAELQKAAMMMVKYKELVKARKELQEVLGLRQDEANDTEDNLEDLSTLDKANMEKYG